MDNSIINNSYVVGIASRDLVLQTFGKVYVKVKDRYYKLDFENNLIENNDSNNESNDVIIINNSSEINDITYPGDNKLIVSLDGKLYATSNGQIHEIVFKAEISNKFETITVNGQVIIHAQDGVPPLVIDSTTMVKNLNANYLNGYTSDQFAIKNKNELITGNWTFDNQIQFTKQITNNSINNENPTTLDFENSTLTIDYINVRKGINIDGETDLFNIKIDGIDGQWWLSPKLYIESFNKIDIDYVVIDDPFDSITRNYEIEKLDNQVNVDIWYDAFFSNYDININPDTYIFRNFDNINEINIANQILLDAGLINENIINYSSIYQSIFDTNLENKYLGEYWEFKIKMHEENFNEIYPNTIVHYGIEDDYSTSISKGVIVNVNYLSKTITVKLTEDSSINFQNNYYWVAIENKTIKNKQGNILFNSFDNIPSFIDVLTDTDYSLINNDNIKARFGRLDSLHETQFGKLNGIGVFLNGKSKSDINKNDVTVNDIINQSKENHSGIFINDSNINNNNKVIINPDGSGFIAAGKIKWDSTGQLNLDIPAGGHLTGNYPNPSIKNNVIINDMIVDGTISPEKLKEQYILYYNGTLPLTSNDDLVYYKSLNTGIYYANDTLIPNAPSTTGQLIISQSGTQDVIAIWHSIDEPSKIFKNTNAQGWIDIGSDADTLDGKHADDFIPSSVTALPFDADIKTITKLGWYISPNWLDKPSGAITQGLMQVENTGNYPIYTFTEIYGTNSGKKWTKSKISHSGGTWTDWIEIPRSASGVNTYSITDWNTIPTTVKSGDILIGSNTATNRPSDSTYLTGIVLSLDNNPTYINIIAFGDKVYRRSQHGGTWGSWFNIADGGKAYNVQNTEFLAAVTGQTRPEDGLTVKKVYLNGYPTSYGNLIRVQGEGTSGGGGELLLGWAGSTALGNIYYRSLRDGGSNWSSWGKLIFENSSTILNKLDLNAIRLPYIGSSWISMATRSDVITSTQNNTVSLAHALYRLKDSDGNAIAFGGLGNNIGFYGFTANRIANNINGTDWGATWNVANGTFTNAGPIISGGRITANNWFESLGATGWVSNSYGGGIYMKDNVHVRVYGNKRFFVSNLDEPSHGGGTGGGALSTDGGIRAGKRIWAAGDIRTDNWFYTYGNNGIYWASHGGGLTMVDDTWIRLTDNKKFYVPNADDANSGNGGSNTSAISTQGGISASKTIWAGGNIRTNAAFMAGEVNGYETAGVYNCGRPTNLNNASCYGFTRDGQHEWGLGYNTSNQIVLGGASSKIISPWVTIAGSGMFEGSDERLKTDIKDVETTAVENIQFKQYIKDGKHQVGVIAQNVLKHMPDAVHVPENPEEMLFVNYNSVLSAKCALYEKKIATLEERLSKLEKLLNNG